MANPKIDLVAVDALIPYARNSRTHSDAQVAQIAASIREFGFTNPVLIDADGGMTELYLDSGTYIKSFYSVMYCPSSVQVGTLIDHRSPHPRLHHKINWSRTAPKIISEKHRKISRNATQTIATHAGHTGAAA